MRSSIVRRTVAGAVLLLLLVACGGGGGGGGGDGGGPQTLFQETFAGAWPGAWEIVQGSPGIDFAEGQPAPSLSMPGGGLSNQPWVTHHPSPGWTWGQGLQVYVFARCDEDTNHGAAQIEVFEIDGTGPGVDALVASVDLAGDLTAGLTIDYTILAQGGIHSATENLPAGSGWHDFVFDVRPDGTASWYRDGVERQTTGADVLWSAPNGLGLGLRGFFAMDVHFDEVLVRTP